MFIRSSVTLQGGYQTNRAQHSAVGIFYILFLCRIVGVGVPRVINVQREKLGLDLKPAVCCLKLVSNPLISPLLQPVSGHTPAVLTRYLQVRILAALVLSAAYFMTNWQVFSQHSTSS